MHLAAINPAPKRFTTYSPSPCTELSSAPWVGVTPPSTTRTPSSSGSRLEDDPVFRPDGTSERSVGSPLIPFRDLIGHCLAIQSDTGFQVHFRWEDSYSFR